MRELTIEATPENVDKAIEQVQRKVFPLVNRI